MEASGVLAVGETTAAMAYVKGRRGLSPRQIMAILLGCYLVIGIPLGAWASGSWLAAAISIEFALMGLAVGVLVVRSLSGPASRRALAARGQPPAHALTCRLAPDVLVYALGELTMTARWPDVTDLYRTRKYWVFLVQGAAMVVPRRFFATAETERAFIAEAMSRMTDAARARSPDAARLAGS